MILSKCAVKLTVFKYHDTDNLFTPKSIKVLAWTLQSNFTLTNFTTNTIKTNKKNPNPKWPRIDARYQRLENVIE